MSEKERKLEVGPLGIHSLFDLYGCNTALLNNRDQLRDILFTAARRANATVLREAFHQFQPQGVSGVLVIAESHLAIHTWPEHGFAAMDLFTCNAELNIQLLTEFLKSNFSASSVEVRTMSRGHTSRPQSLLTQFA